MSADGADPRPGGFAVRQGSDGTDARVVFAGELDLVGAAALDAVLERVERTEARRILLDLSDVGFMDATGLRCVLGAQARGRARRRPLVLVQPSRRVRRLLTLCQLEGALSNGGPPEMSGRAAALAASPRRQRAR